ncbi:nucleolin 1 [Iris pallida]|uniref:Nucleolin 1 n=1 Tax=Iris pallida TaxID=29817 RepID=A0AAX6GXC4_IRIPA|nr:nucleolin 1 [Iris pallida]KAJ6852566.1 nucleolin 1 [Iris pallida]
MDGSAPSGDDRMLRSVFSGDGAAKLRERVKEKLKELLENYTDDTLVEYVLVLVKNGRCKDEARKELDVFLGDDCAPFVSWLWDHLSLNLHLYVEPKVSLPVSTTRSIVKEISRTLPRYLNGCVQSSSEDNKVGPANTCRNRHNREWRGLVKEEDTFFVQTTMTENFTLQEKTHHGTNVRTKYYHSEGQTRHRTKTATGNFCLEEKDYQRTNLTSGNVFLKDRSYHQTSLDKRSHYPIFLNHKKRSRQDERRQTKIYATSRPSPPCRIFQFALQDVVRSVQQTRSTKEPAPKRLRSVISTSTSYPTFENQHQMTRPISRLSGAEEALNNVRRSRNLFRRSSHDMCMPEAIHQLFNSEPLLLEGDLTEFGQIPVSSSLDYFDRGGYDAELTRDMTTLEGGTRFSSESDNEEYGEDVDVDTSPARLMDLDSPATDVTSKIMNLSVNVNTWKPPYHENPRDSAKVGNLLYGEKGDLSAGKPYFLLNSAAASEKVKDVVHAEVQKGPQKPVASLLDSHCTSHSGDDIDSRILFVSNASALCCH